MFLTLISIVHVAICLFLVLIVLLQQGKGADAGATFGGGGNTFFGASGADNLLTRVTTFTAIAFMCTSILLATSSSPTAVVDTGFMKDLPDAAPPPVSQPLTVDLNNNKAAPLPEGQNAPVPDAAIPAPADANSAPAAANSVPAVPAPEAAAPVAPPAAAPVEVPAAPAAPAAESAPVVPANPQ